MKPLRPQPQEPLRLLSVIIPARDEEGRVGATVEHLYVELQQALHRVPTLRPVQNSGGNGFGRAVTFGLDQARGDAMVVMMADESDDCRDVVRYWELLNEGWDAVFGSRFVRGGGVIDYPQHKLVLNRLANLFLRIIFHVPFNDFTNAFKAYRRKAIEGCRPFLSPHFNLTIEIPLKTMVRGYSWTVMPITWRNRRSGVSKLKIREMGSRYLFIALYCWLEKYFSRGDYVRVASREPMTRDREEAKP
jgi:dolichol-phosphate mannosyltransferase